MSKPLTAFITTAILGVFLSIYVLSFATSQARYAGTVANVSGVLDPNLVNATTSANAVGYQSFQSSASDQTSQLSLYKNAPSVIKQQTSLGFRVFGNLIAGAHAQYLAGWVVAIIVSLFLIFIVAMLVRVATGQTP